MKKRMETYFEASHVLDKQVVRMVVCGYHTR